MSKVTICAGVRELVHASVKKVVEERLQPRFPYELVFGESATAFESVKARGEKIYLIVETEIGHEVIKYLCDDVNLPLSQRRVQLVYSMSAGMDAYRLSELHDELVNIPLFNGKDVYSDILGEHVIFSMLYFNRSPWRLCASKAAKLYDKFNMIELRGQKVGIFGYGSIGQAAGVRAKALGMDVTGIRRTVPASGVDEHGIRVCTDESADKVLAESDFIVGVLPGTAATQHFFRREVFAKMKPSAVFINIGRGVTQCEADLVEALNAGTIRGAALDVFEVEPLPAESPLWDLPDDKLLLSAHCANLTSDMFSDTIRRFCGILIDIHERGETQEIPVNLELGY